MVNEKKGSCVKQASFSDGVIAVVVVALGIWIMSPSSEPPKEQASPLPAPKIIHLKKNTLLCYERDDWLAMSAGIQDGNLPAMRVLMESGRCMQTSHAEKASYLDPFLNNAALIQMPSGRTAFVFEADIQR